MSIRKKAQTGKLVVAKSVDKGGRRLSLCIFCVCVFVLETVGRSENQPANQPNSNKYNSPAVCKQERQITAQPNMHSLGNLPLR